MRCEAESATLSGGAVVASDRAGYTGSGSVGGYTDAYKGTATTTFGVTATAGTNLALRYANGAGRARRFPSWPTESGWNRFRCPRRRTGAPGPPRPRRSCFWRALTPSSTFYHITDSGDANLDNLTVSASTNTPAGPGEAEGAFLSSGATAATATSGYNGTGYVSGFDHVGARMIRTVVMASAGTATATVRFANSSGANRVLAVSADGQDAGSVSLRRGPAGAPRPCRCRCARG